jgi:hypothetical protein
VPHRANLTSLGCIDTTVPGYSDAQFRTSVRPELESPQATRYPAGSWCHVWSQRGSAATNEVLNIALYNFSASCKEVRRKEPEEHGAPRIRMRYVLDRVKPELGDHLGPTVMNPWDDAPLVCENSISRTR